MYIKTKTEKVFKNNSGITLIALVITILVLLILAGVTLNTLLGEGGVIQRAQDAKVVQDKATLEEQLKMEVAGNYDTFMKLNASTLKSSIEADIQGATVTGSDFPLTVTANGLTYTITSNGTVTKSTEPEPEEEGPVAGGSYDKPYIPAGFTHTEGTWNNGYTIKGKAGTTNANDEFVWVPCVLDAATYPTVANNTNTIKEGDSLTTFGKTTTEKYNEYSFGLLPTDTTVAAEDETVDAIRTSVGTYGGFYIAKYEAGIDNNTTDNYGLAEANRKTIADKPLSQPGKGVWNQISRADAITVSKAMVSTTDNVKSTLISGECWDTTLQWMVNTSDNHAQQPNLEYDTNSADKGWYSNNSSNTRHLTGRSTDTTNATTPNKVNNIWDMAGNVLEWTTENCKFRGNAYLVNRGR